MMRIVKRQSNFTVLSSNIRNSQMAGKEKLRVKSSFSDDVVDVKFSVLDLLRIFAGLIMAYCCICRFFIGSWYWQPFRRHAYTEPRSPLEIPSYWFEKHNNLPIPFSADDLSNYGSNSESHRILLSVKGHVFDVTSGSRFYGEWGPYKKFTGRDCSRLFAYPKWDISVLSRDCSHDLSSLTPTELERVDSWLQFFRAKYPEIGYVESLP